MLEERTLQARKRLLWQAALLLPLALLAVLILTVGVGRPLRQLDRAISELGEGTFTNPIAVSGPHDLERLGGQLEWLRQRLLELAHERNRFLRHMSHELKTPLANIREGTELLMDGAVGELDSNQREVAAILRENGIKLQRMIENLLSFSAWQTSSVGLEATEFRLRPLVKQVLENQQLTLLSQRVRLDVHVEDVTLVADRGKIRLILENLVSNAVKYSPKGGTIHLMARTTGAQLVLDVADGGPGIPVEDRAHVFDAFYTGRAARSTAVKGTGIGLSVVLEFVSAHGGTVQIIDGQFPGAHFRITMPIRASTGDRPLRRAQGAGPCGLAPSGAPGWRHSAPPCCSRAAPGLMSGQRTPAPPAPVNPAATNSTVLADYLELLQRLVAGPATEQAEIVASAQHDYDTAPTPSHQLRLALILGTTATRPPTCRAPRACCASLWPTRRCCCRRSARWPS